MYIFEEKDVSPFELFDFNICHKLFYKLVSVALFLSN